MSVRQYTQAERDALGGYLGKPTFDALSLELERDIALLCDGQPPDVIARAVFALLQRAPELRDVLDTIDDYCARTGCRIGALRWPTLLRTVNAEALPGVLCRRCENLPLMVIGAGLHGLTCGNVPVRDALDALCGVVEVSDAH
jgi:hypothetical protein